MLSRISAAAAEYTIGLTYLEYLAALPWHRTTEDNLDLARAERILDEHHYGLGQVKERILEHLAIKALRRRRQPRVLAVDDDETARRNLVLALARENCEVVTAASAREALEQLEAREFDLLLTDLHLGQSDGMELLERTRARWPDTRVVVITGYASIPSAVEAVKKGAFQYLAKPFAIEELRSIVRRALEGRALLKGTKGSVLCFAGPPGTGKTSVGRAIAQALGRTFSRISLGGIRDEADIRGHRRTYAGAKPGRVIEEIRRVESANPVLMLDELDKIGREVKGDPASALLEVLDPEQNRAFLDHYLDVPFDLSGVLFIVTVNLTDPVPEALLDRLEVIEFPGYTEEEKAQIAARFLCPKQLREKGLGSDQVIFTPEAIGTIIREYTREAGIRSLERRIATVCRKIARESLGVGAKSVVTVTPELVEGWLGRRLLATRGHGRGGPRGGGDGPRAHRERRGDHLRRGGADARHQGADHHRLARRGDARIRPGGPELPAQQRGRLRHPGRIFSSATTCTSTSRAGRSRRTGHRRGSRFSPRSPRCSPGVRRGATWPRPARSPSPVACSRSAACARRFSRRAGPGWRRSSSRPPTSRRSRNSTRRRARGIEIHPAATVPRGPRRADPPGSGTRS